MIRNVLISRLNGLTRPRNASRASLYATGAFVGVAVSVVASYAAVDLFYPRYLAAFQKPAKDIDDAPKYIVYTKQTFGVDVSSWHRDLMADLAAPGWMHAPDEIAAMPDLRTATLSADDFGSAPILEADSSQPAATARSFGSTIVFSSMSSPSVPTDEAAAVMPQVVLASLGDLPFGALPATPEAYETPAAFAAQSEADIDTRAGATLAYGAPSLAPEARPETVDIAALVAEAALPSRRPAPRPMIEDAAYDVAALDTAVDAAVDAAIAEVVDTFTGAVDTSIRPAPRPAEILRVAALTNVTPAATAPAVQPQPVAAAEQPTFRLPRLSGNAGCGTSLARAMPSRRSNAPTGSQFINALANSGGSDRDNRIINELARGNMPRFMRDLHPVVFTGQDSRGADTQIVICVTPDYLALGSDRDFVRVPMGLPAAAAIAGQFGMTLPTPRMVDAIYAQSEVHLSPAPMQAGPQMSSTAYLLRHNATIEAQRAGRTGLISGHKKDVVMASRMASNPGRVAIYGWHRASGNPIQPVSTVHGASYADYSHGIRLVSRTAFLNGKAVDIDDLLGSSQYAYLLNSDGPLPGPVIRIASR